MRSAAAHEGTSMRVGRSVGRVQFRGVGVALAAVALLVAACGGNAGGSPRPTDPHLIAAAAVRATADLPTLRLHIESSSSMNMNGVGVGANVGVMQMAMTIDADIDLVNRQFAGREAMTFKGGPIANQPMPGGQTVDLISTTTASFMRQGGG